MATTSYAKVVKHFNLSEGQINEECSFVTILKVHKRVTGWRNVAPYLFMPDKAQEIVETVDQCSHLNDVGKRLELLTRWKQCYGSEATYKMLVEAFLSADRRDLAEEVCRALNNGELFLFFIILLPNFCETEYNKCQSCSCSGQGQPWRSLFLAKLKLITLLPLLALH